MEIPPSYRALQFTSPSAPPTLTTLPTPPLMAGTALVRPLRANLFAYTRDIFTRGNPRGYHFPTPLIPGSAAIARLIAASSDAPTLSSSSGALVYIDPVIRAADLSHTQILHGLNSGPSAAGKALAAGEWRNGSWGELVRVPAENVHLLDEAVLLHELGYTLDDLGYLLSLMITYGGLRDVDVRPGETVLVAPATGSFGGAAVHVALALGARVIAMGRNSEILKELQDVAARAYPGSKMAVLGMAGTVDENVEAIKGAARALGSRDGTVDVYFDMSPPSASQSPHIKAGIAALRPKGRMSLMGGAAGDVGFPYYQIMVKGLTLQGSWMFTPSQIDDVIRLVETGRLKLGKVAGVECLGVFELDEWEKAFQVAGDGGRVGRFALFAPSGKDAL
ncbi:NAD(P)-binding protein [Echria macrotheca]|uniref:NAD(P)-binding protein n=1 Tax=Echria macrotheca TaxID=438768 RepID=A0AAJ0B1Z5_9PEZI|nr:NAD(P)-binding protein [Echria macrotheca]